jgi:hypothetical protein
MTPQEIREQAARLIERGWTQGAYAREKSGRPVSPFERHATRWCMLGALDRAGRGQELCSQAISDVTKAVGGAMTDFNDAPDRTQADVIAALRGTYQPPQEAQP